MRYFIYRLLVGFSYYYSNILALRFAHMARFAILVEEHFAHHSPKSLTDSSYVKYTNALRNAEWGYPRTPR